MKTHVLTVSLMISLVITAVLPVSVWAQAEGNAAPGHVALHDGNRVSAMDGAEDVIRPLSAAECGGATRCSQAHRLWRSPELMALTMAEQWIEVDCPAPTSSVGVQFHGDDNDGWVRVYVDGQLYWHGNTYGYAQGGAPFVRYLDITELPQQPHVIRVEATGQRGHESGDLHVAVVALTCRGLDSELARESALASSHVYLPTLLNSAVENQ